MKKIPTLFEREFTEDHKAIVTMPPKVISGMEWVMNGEGIATVKIDGACCAMIDGQFYKRYDAKIGKNGVQKPVPDGAIKCQDEPDPVTGHLPCWVLVTDKPEDKWYREAFKNAIRFETLIGINSQIKYCDWTYEAIGKHFQGNPYKLDYDILEPHGAMKANTLNNMPYRTSNDIKFWLQCHNVEGIVFWKDGKPQCKIKRKDFGLPWPDHESIPISHYRSHPMIFDSLK